MEVILSAFPSADDRPAFGAGIYGDVIAVSHGILLDIADHFLKHVEAFFGVGCCRIHLSQCTQADAVLQIIHGLNVIHPAVVHHPQQNHALHFTHPLCTDLCFLLVIEPAKCGLDVFHQLVFCQIVNLILCIGQAREGFRNSLQIFRQAGKIPFFGELAFYRHRLDQAFHQCFHHAHDVLLQVFAEEHLAPLVIDDFTLLVHDVVVLKHVFTDFKVAAFHFFLRVFNGLGQHAGSDRLILHAELIHNALDPVSAKETHQVIFQ